MRSIWKGRMGFGLVGMNVKLHKAVDQSEISFHLMHTECGGGRIRMLYQCQNCQTVLDSRPKEKGYEYAEGQYVILSEADFQALPLKSLKQIEILGFVRDGIDARAIEATYYLSPDKGGTNQKPFQLLYTAMERLGVQAIGKLAYRDREHLCVIQPFDGIMLCQTLCYAQEIRPHQELKQAEVALSEKETELGEALVQQMVMVFNFSVFQDEYQKALEELIQAKIEGRELTPVAQDEAPSGDLVGQLLASIGMK